MIFRLKEILPVVLLISFSFSSCQKDSKEKEYNKITFTSGGFEGFSYTFSVNKAFWAQATASTKSIMLNFGDDEMLMTQAPFTGQSYFYHSGEASIDFLSNEGQSMWFAFNDQDTNYFRLDAKEVTMTFEEVTDNHIKGNISGEFYNTATSATTFVVMDYSMEMAPLK